MNNSSKLNLVKHALLAVQRYPWEQGVAMQAFLEAGDVTTFIAMAHDAVLRQKEDGRLAVINENIAVTDPAACGEAVYRAYSLTNDTFYLDAAKKMLNYLMHDAPRTDRNVLCHNEISFHEGFSPNQIWVDSIYMAPPFLAVMGELDEAYYQIGQMVNYLRDKDTGILFHIFDATQNRFVRQKLWATGNGWALMGMARVIDSALDFDRADIYTPLKKTLTELLDSMLRFQLDDGRFHDILNDENSFVDGASAMMMATAVYKGCSKGWLPSKYLIYADKVLNTMDQYVDDYGIIHHVCGCPDFISEGTSAESMAAYIMMHANHSRLT